jgi:hypothetical protein
MSIEYLREWRRKLWRKYVFGLRQYIPKEMRQPAGRLYGAYIFWRIRPSVTQRLGPRYHRSRDRIDIDITWECNLNCFHCNRSCQQAPTKEMMTVGQVKQFLEETRQRNISWKKIQLIGGEPTLHPEFDKILQLMLEFRGRYSPKTEIKVTSNGFGPKVNEVLRRIPAGVTVHNTQKTSRNQETFVPFNLAPCDSPEYACSDFRNACCVTRDAGIGLTPYGYYPCVGSGAIDRIFGFDCGRKSLPDPEDDMDQELIRFCSLCGFFRLNYTSDIGAGSEMLLSETWQRAYSSWRQQPPVFTRYPEQC